MIYNHKCEKCGNIQKEEYSMKEPEWSSHKDVGCKKCDGVATRFTDWSDGSPTTYVRGQGIVNDKAGAYRDMHLHRLMKDDPYAKLRPPGEKDDLANRLKRGGKIIKKTRYPLGFTKGNDYYSRCDKCKGSGVINNDICSCDSGYTKRD